MLHTVGDLLGSPVVASDGLVGRVLDAFFDERNWQIRYVLVEVSVTGRDRAVIYPSEAIVSIDAEEGLRVEDLPPFDVKAAKRLRSLRSARAVLDCEVAGWSGSIGRTADALFDGASWALQFLMVDASIWRPGAVVFIRLDLIQEAHWDRQSFSIAVTRVELLNLPDVDGADSDVSNAERVLH